MSWARDRAPHPLFGRRRVRSRRRSSSNSRPPAGFEQRLETRNANSGFRSAAEQKNGIRLDDEVRFIRMDREAAVAGRGNAFGPCARAHGGLYRSEPPGRHRTGAGHRAGDQALWRRASIPRGSCWSSSIRPSAAVARAPSQGHGSGGDAYSLKRLLGGLMQNQAAGVVPACRCSASRCGCGCASCSRSLRFDVAGRALLQFTHNAVPPIPKRLERVSAEPSERVWMNIRRRGCGSIGETDDDIRRRRAYGIVGIRPPSIRRPSSSAMAVPKFWSFRSLRASRTTCGSPAREQGTALADADVTRISLVDYPLPIHDADTAEIRAAAQRGQAQAADVRAPGVFIASRIQRLADAAHQNTIDWISAVRERAGLGWPPTRIASLPWAALRPAAPAPPFIAGVAPGAGVGCPRWCLRAGDVCRIRARLRRHGRTDGCARGQPAQGGGASQSIPPGCLA